MSSRAVLLPNDISFVYNVFTAVNPSDVQLMGSVAFETELTQQAGLPARVIGIACQVQRG